MITYQNVCTSVIEMPKSKINIPKTRSSAQNAHLTNRKQQCRHVSSKPVELSPKEVKSSFWGLNQGNRTTDFSVGRTVQPEKTRRTNRKQKSEKQSPQNEGIVLGKSDNPAEKQIRHFVGFVSSKPDSACQRGNVAKCDFTGYCNYHCQPLGELYNVQTEKEKARWR